MSLSNAERVLWREWVDLLDDVDDDVLLLFAAGGGDGGDDCRRDDVVLLRIFVLFCFLLFDDDDDVLLPVLRFCWPVVVVVLLGWIPLSKNSEPGVRSR